MARILYADDSEIQRDSFSRVSSKFGHEPVAVDDDARAWELLQKGESFDLVISDYSMPEMDGLDLLRNMRKDPRTAKTPFVLRSSSNDQVLVDICKELDARFFNKSRFPIHDLIPELLPP